MNKLIIIFQHYFTEKEFQKLNLKDFIKKNISIEIWVMQKLLKNNVIHPNMKSKKKLKIRNISNISELENKIKSQQKDNIIYQMQLKFELKSIKIFQLITKYNCKYFISPGLTIYTETTLVEKFSILGNKLLSLDFVYLYKKFIKKITNVSNQFIFNIKINFFSFKKADFHYCRAKKYFDHNKNNILISKKTKIIWGHQKDYEFFLENKKNKIQNIKKQIVFLDQNVPYHSDLITLGVADVNSDDYYSSINNFLEKLSNKLKISAHVCCHPRTDIKKMKHFFPKISLGQGDTVKKIKNAKCLIVHDSTALNFGILYSKPIIYIVNNSLLHSKWQHMKEIENTASRLKKKVYNIDEDEKLIFKNIIKELKVNYHNYWVYVKNYIKFKGTKKNSAEETISKLKLYKVWK